MRVEYLNHILLPSAKSNLRTCNALADVPIAPPKRCWSAIERVLEHGALLNGPPTQDGQTASEGTTVVELRIRQHMSRPPPNRQIIIMDPAFLQTDDIRRGNEEGDLAANFVEARGPEFRDMEEAPAVEGEEVERCHSGLRVVWDEGVCRCQRRCWLGYHGCGGGLQFMRDDDAPGGDSDPVSSLSTKRWQTEAQTTAQTDSLKKAIHGVCGNDGWTNVLVSETWWTLRLS